MSWSDTKVGKPPGVYGGIASNAAIPASIKSLVKDVLANYPQDCMVVVDTSGHVENASTNNRWGNLKLEIRIYPEAVDPIEKADSA
jgi:hypothetical protein